MLTTTLLLATLAVGIDTGYEPTPEGGLEYIIQIPPDVLQTLKPGEAITSEIPDDLQGVKRYRIQVGTGRLPRIHAPEAIQAAAEAPLPSPTAVPHKASLQSQDRKSPFEFGPNTNNSAAIAAPAANYPDDRYGSRAPVNNQAGMNSITSNASNSAPQFPVADTELPLKLPPPPDGLDHLYNPPVAANANQNYPAQGQPNGYPNNQYVSANTYPNNQYPNNQFPNNQYQGNPYPNGGYPNNQFPNGGIPNNNFANNVPNGGFPNGSMPMTGMPNGAIPNNGFVNNSQAGNPQVPQGYQANQASGESRPVGTLANHAPSIHSESEEVSPGDVLARQRLKAEDELPKPWLPMYVTGLAAVGSLLGNLYLAWMWLETRRRYRQVVIERTLAV